MLKEANNKLPKPKMLNEDLGKGVGVRVFDEFGHRY